MKVVLLDATPLGILANPKRTSDVLACRLWAAGLSAAGCRLIVPEVTDYEVRRELLRLVKTRSIAALDALAIQFEYLPIHTPAFRKAAELWADARRRGRPTADPHALDGDVLLAAQALTLPAAGPLVVATGNQAHLSRYVAAELWSSVTA